MISLFIKEQKRYSQKQLAELLHYNFEQTTAFIKQLKQYGVLKAVKANIDELHLTDLTEENIEIEDTTIGESEYYYVFTFVGVITAFGRVLKCYPKYVFSSAEPTKHLKTVLKVLEKYNAKEQIVRIFNDSDDSNSFNLLAIILYLLKDFYENGSYTNTKNIIETNGDGEILWDKTINESFTYLSNQHPYYINLYTKKRVNNNFDYFKRLHETIISICSKELRDSGLDDLFDIEVVDLSDEEMDQFGDQTEILYNIKREMETQFNTRKRNVLQSLYTYIAQKKHLWNVDSFSMFGTNSYNLVWQKVCSEVLENQLQTRIKNLPVSIPNVDQSQKLINVVEKPKWHGKNNEFTREAKDTLIPDIVSLDKLQKGYIFIIFDAKYYNLTLEPHKLLGQPGVADVTKQYLYQLAFKNIIAEKEIFGVRNCFLMPTECNVVVDKGSVSMDILESIPLESILVRQLPVEEVYSKYIHNQKFDIKKLNL